jgi:hypothetical protein
MFDRIRCKVTPTSSVLFELGRIDDNQFGETIKVQGAVMEAKALELLRVLAEYRLQKFRQRQ